MTQPSLNGRFLWYDLMTEDPDAAQGFYTKLIGWGTQQWEGPQPYTMWTNNDTPLGGLMQLPEEAKQGGAPPHWLAYVGSEDVAATAAKAEELGGKVLVPPTDIPNAGTFAVLQDPQGAVFAAYTPPEGTPMSDEPPKRGEFSWHELATTDFGAAFDFYSKLFGWQVTESMDMGQGNIYQMYGQADRTLGGMFNKPPEMPVPFWLYYVTVEDVEQSVKQIQEMGGQVVNGPMEVPGGDKVAQCVDPQGAMFAVHSPLPKQ
jgi:predicted enzyme related to lactoylglutathione lyase